MEIVPIMLTILCGDALEKLRELPDESVHCCVTSPPYWGLRDYGTAQWEGGDTGCDHTPEDRGGRFATPVSSKQASNTGSGTASSRDCKCGAKRIDSQIGLEKTPEEYVEKIVTIFREVHRVLRKDGTLWLNLGSSYASDPAKGGSGPNGKNESRWSYGRASRRDAQKNDKPCKEHEDSPENGYAYSGLCDECEAALSIRNVGNFQPIPESSALPGKKARGKSRSDCVEVVAGAEPPVVLASTNPESSEQPPASCFHCANCGACLSVIRSSSRDASLCARKASCIEGTSGRVSESRNQGKDVSGLAYSTIAFPEFKAKDLIPIPWMVAIALQADGAADWKACQTIDRVRSKLLSAYEDEPLPDKVIKTLDELDREYAQAKEGSWWLRSDIIWHKPNPMPESCTDRPTKSHEYLFLLTKSASYFYDAEAIKEAGSGRIPGNVVPQKGAGMDGFEIRGGLLAAQQNPQIDRNKRSVWTVATAPYPEAHFATYPPDLIKPCILAGTSAKGCCAKCGAPWERVVESDREATRPGRFSATDHTAPHLQARGSGGNTELRFRYETTTKTLGWQPTCVCNLSGGLEEPKRAQSKSELHINSNASTWNDSGDSGGTTALPAVGKDGGINKLPAPPAQTISCTVLDPFAGSGTTGAVALELGRKAILIELNPKYVELIERRCDVTPGLALA